MLVLSLVKQSTLGGYAFAKQLSKGDNMNTIRSMSYHPLAFIDGETLTTTANTVIGQIANMKIMDRNQNTLGYIDGHDVVNARGSVVAHFEDGEVLDNHNHIIGHYDGGDHAGAAACALFTLFK